MLIGIEIRFYKRAGPLSRSKQYSKRQSKNFIYGEKESDEENIKKDKLFPCDMCMCI